MSTLYITQGLQGSGKSTFAEKAVKESKGTLIEVNRDNIRRAQEDYSPRFNRAFEKRVKGLRDAQIMSGLRSGKNVICSDTNLAPSTLRELEALAERCGADVQMLTQCLDIPVEECIKRDLQREHRVGKDVILRTFHDFVVPNHEEAKKLRNTHLPDAIMVDIDGTLAHMDGKRHPYEAKYDEDRLDESVSAVIYALYANHYPIYILSGREGTALAQEQTKTWLEHHGVPYTALFMRAEGDSRPDEIVKKEIYLEHIHPNHNVIAVFDDRPKVVRMWRMQGLKVFDCGMGYEF